MLRDIRKTKIFNRRTFFVSGAQAGLAAILTARLGYLQLWKHKEYSVQSNSNSIKPVISPAGRGAVLDRKGVAMTVNQDSYRLLFYVEDKENAAKIVEELGRILRLGENVKRDFHARIKKAKKRSMITLIDNISWDDMARIEVNSYKIPGISIESGVLRQYLFPFETAHFLGYVSLPNEKEIDSRESGLYLHPNFRIGKTGLESSFDNALRGKYGVKYVEVNALERPIRTMSIRQSIDGAPLNVTIDLELQKFVTRRVKDLMASVVVMDVKTGEILSYVSSPSFDPNDFVEGISSKTWKKLNEDPKRPLNNKPVSAIYPPGSTFKLVVALAALENGIDEGGRVFCNGHYQLGKRRFHCWKDGGHGKVNMVEAIEQSCNVYFFDLANRLGIDKINEMARRFGYGEMVDISLYGSRSGNVPSDEWKQKVFHQPWVGGDTLNTAIGQGFVLATPVQMALITARIANGGVPIKPYLVKNDDAKTQFENLQNKKLVANKRHLNLVLEGMNRVVNNPKGTSYWRRITQKGFEMAGKTGTSQVISKREDEMTKAENALNANQNHAIFVGFAPVSNPKYAISVVVEHGGSGSVAAAPVGRDVLYEAQRIAKKDASAVFES